ncbi:hypothetical protein [Verrucomicrobium spinosum]|uniref:hypothetical protein n=1 Tax=Verrucomicrobium spinosum TaxID=2736 RepID=UPI0001744C05|nr:hypothetical protein [Verrucomicrobium spinosum]
MNTLEDAPRTATPQQAYDRLTKEYTAAVGRVQRLETSKAELIQKRTDLLNSDGEASKIAKGLSTTDSEIELQEHRLRTATSERDGFWKALREPARGVLSGLIDELTRLSDIEQDKRRNELMAVVTGWGVDPESMLGRANEIAGHHPLVVRPWREAEGAKAVRSSGDINTASLIQHINSCSATVADLAPIITAK